MKQMIKGKITVFERPYGKQRPRFNPQTKTAYTPEKTRIYERAIGDEWAWTVKEKMPEGSRLSISIVAQFAPNKGEQADFRKKGITSFTGKPYPKKPDADNILKLVCDGLNGIAYDDDRQIVEMHCTKQYGIRDCMIITVEEVDGNDTNND